MCRVDIDWSAFLNNQSLAAFVGALSAYFLVIFTDWRRRRKRKAQLRALIDIAKKFVEKKQMTVSDNIRFMREKNTFTAAPIMKFSVASFQSIQAEVVDLLSSDEYQSLDAIAYWMTGIDDLLEKARQMADELGELPSNATIARGALGKRMLEVWQDAERNLRILAQMCEWYVAGEAEKIINIRIPIPPPDGK